MTEQELAQARKNWKPKAGSGKTRGNRCKPRGESWMDWKTGAKVERGAK